MQVTKAEAIFQKLTQTNLSEIAYYHFIPEVEVSGKKTLISRTGYTGEDGFEIYCEPKDAVYLWEQIMDAGKEEGLIPTGLTYFYV